MRMTIEGQGNRVRRGSAGAGAEDEAKQIKITSQEEKRDEGRRKEGGGCRRAATDWLTATAAKHRMNEMKLRKKWWNGRNRSAGKGDVMQQMVDDNRGMEDWATENKRLDIKIKQTLEQEGMWQINWKHTAKRSEKKLLTRIFITLPQMISDQRR